MTILAAYRPTAEGDAALIAAIAEAKARNDELLVARHIQVDEDDHRVPQREQEVQADLDRIEESLAEQGVRCRTNWSVGPLKASRAILDLEEREQPDMIVIGLRRRSAVGKLVLGSDAQDILLQAHAPVLAIKAPE